MENGARDEIKEAESAAGPPRTRRLLALFGIAISWAAMLTYFTVVPRWPDLRDSGIPSVLAGATGLALTIAGVRRARASAPRRGGAFLLLLALVPSAFLAFYVLHLSYQLPPPGGVAAVGAFAPDLQLRDQHGRQRSLGEFAGQWVVLDFFRGPW
jgi:hypothetical protein